MRILIIAKKVFKELFRDKRTLSMMFVAPVFIMWLLSIVFSTNTNETVNIAVINTPSQIVDTMNNIENVNVEKLSTKEEAEEKLKDGIVDTIIFYYEDNYNITYANIDSTKTLKSRQALKSSISIIQNKNLVEIVNQTNPNLNTSQKVNVINEAYVYGNADTTFFNKIVPILIGFISFFFVFLISGMALLKERTTGTLDRLLATPVKRSDIIFGYTISYSILAIIQTIIITLSAIYLLNIEVAGHLIYVIIINVLLALVALSLGLLISTLAKSEFQVMQFVPLIIIPQVFFSGIVYLEGMGNIAVYISKVLPVTYAGEALSKIILEGKNLLQIKTDIYALFIFFVILITLNIIGLKRYRKV